MNRLLSPEFSSQIAVVAGGWGLIVVALLSIAGCPVRFQSCVRDQDCPVGDLCLDDGTCGAGESVEPDPEPNGRRDGGTTDDAGVKTDGGLTLDGGRDAGGLRDAGHADDGGGGPPDAGLVDGGAVDAGQGGDGGRDAGALLDSGRPNSDCDNDGDGDGYGDGCDLGPDCDDTNPDLFQNIALYVDDDGDGFGAGAIVDEGCIGLSSPVGQVSNNTDCDDTDPNRFVLRSLFSRQRCRWLHGAGQRKHLRGRNASIRFRHVGSQRGEPRLRRHRCTTRRRQSRNL